MKGRGGKGGAQMPQPRRGRLARTGGRALFRAGLGLALVLLVLAAAGYLMSGRPVALPLWAVAEAERRATGALGGRVLVALGGVELTMDGARMPWLRLSDVRLTDPAGAPLARLPEIRLGFAPGALMQARLRPAVLRLSGAQLLLRREADGAFGLSFGEGPGGGAPASMAEVLDRLEEVLALPVLEGLDRVEAEGVMLRLDDRRVRRVWTVGDGRIVLVAREDDVAMELGFGLLGGDGMPARAELTFVTARGGAESRLSARVDHVPAADIAAQSPVLGWLGVLDAPISGELRARFDAAGEVAAIEGALGLGAGALSPVEGARPIAFDRAGIAFAYDPGAARIAFSDISVDSPSLRLTATGHTDLTEMEGGLPGAFVSQIRFTEARLDPEGVFAEPARFSEGAIDLRLRLDPFSVTIGQLMLRDDGRRLVASGGVEAGAAGWTVTMDAALDTIRPDRLLAMWPPGLAPRTRLWLVQNVQEGLLFDVQAALRIRPGQEPRIALGWEFENAEVRFLNSLPPIRGGYGRSGLEGQTYTLVLDRGHVEPEAGGRVEVRDSLFRVPDITKRPPEAEIVLQASGSVEAALSLLDRPPFSLLSRAGLPVDLAEGRAEARAEINLPLMPRPPLDRIRYRVNGVLTEVTSDRIAPGRRIGAERLVLEADPSGVSISGPGRIGAVRFDAAWRQEFLIHPGRVVPVAMAADTHGPPMPPAIESAGSRVEGEVELSPAFMAEFLPALPEGSAGGAGRAAFEIALARGEPPEFRLRSDLHGLSLRIPQLGWSLPAATTGRLEATGRLSSPPVLDGLVLEAPGLAARGTMQMEGAGGTLRLSEVRLGQWFRGTAEIAARPGAPADISVTGGTADLRELPAGGLGGGGGGAGPAAAAGVAVTLDRLDVTGNIHLTGVRGSFAAGAGGLNGRFTGRVGGAAPVTGQIEPTASGSAFRITAQDAGAVFRAAGIFERAHGGSMDLVLLPAGARGHYDGQISLRDMRVRNLPVLAELLNAISIVGLLEQLNSSGLLFAEAGARLRLTPEAITIREGAATGASVGVSLEGSYDMRSRAMDLRGVISPIYLINSIGALISRPGEGLFGFNFRIHGPADRVQVSINPLSVLAPGFLRDIFRGSPGGGDRPTGWDAMPEAPGR